MSEQQKMSNEEFNGQVNDLLRKLANFTQSETGSNVSPVAIGLAMGLMSADITATISMSSPVEDKKALLGSIIDNLTKDIRMRAEAAFDHFTLSESESAEV